MDRLRIAKSDSGDDESTKKGATRLPFFMIIRKRVFLLLLRHGLLMHHHGDAGIAHFKGFKLGFSHKARK